MSQERRPVAFMTAEDIDRLSDKQLMKLYRQRESEVLMQCLEALSQRGETAKLERVAK